MPDRSGVGSTGPVRLSPGAAAPRRVVHASGRSSNSTPSVPLRRPPTSGGSPILRSVFLCVQHPLAQVMVVLSLLACGNPPEISKDSVDLSYSRLPGSRLQSVA